MVDTVRKCFPGEYLDLPCKSMPVLSLATPTMPSGGYELLKPDSAGNTPSPRSRYRLVTGIVLVSLAAYLGLKSGANFLSDERYPTPLGAHDDVASVGQCVANAVPPASPPALANPWASLTVSEIVQIQDWLFAPEQGLNLTLGEIAAPSDNHLYIIETYYPPKNEVLEYLSSPVTVDLPPRFARVTVHHGAAQEPTVRNYLVGPLPIGPHTGMSPLTEIYQVDPIPYNARSFDTRDWSSPEIYSNIAAPVAEAFEVGMRDFVLHFVAH